MALSRNWSVVQIGELKSRKFRQWELRNNEVRENLQWAVILPGDGDSTPRVLQLLAEIAARGVEIQRCVAQDT